MSVRREREPIPQPNPKKASELTLVDLKEIARRTGAKIDLVDTNDLSGYRITHDVLGLTILIDNTPHKLPKTLITIEGQSAPIRINDPRVNLSQNRSVSFIVDGDIFTDSYVLASEFYSHSRIINAKK